MVTVRSWLLQTMRGAGDHLQGDHSITPSSLGAPSSWVPAVRAFLRLSSQGSRTLLKQLRFAEPSHTNTTATQHIPAVLSPHLHHQLRQHQLVPWALLLSTGRNAPSRGVTLGYQAPCKTFQARCNGQEALPLTAWRLFQFLEVDLSLGRASADVTIF